MLKPLPVRLADTVCWHTLMFSRRQWPSSKLLSLLLPPSLLSLMLLWPLLELCCGCACCSLLPSPSCCSRAAATTCSASDRPAQQHRPGLEVRFVAKAAHCRHLFLKQWDFKLRLAACMQAPMHRLSSAAGTCCDPHVVVVRHVLLGGAGDRVVVLRQCDRLLQGIRVGAIDMVAVPHLPKHGMTCQGAEPSVHPRTVSVIQIEQNDYDVAGQDVLFVGTNKAASHLQLAGCLQV